jgi:hypothetical protein
MAKRKQMWLGASTYRRQRSAGWQRPALSRQAWSPREEALRMKESKVPRVPPCSEAGGKLWSPVSAFFGKKSLRFNLRVEPRLGDENIHA